MSCDRKDIFSGSIYLTDSLDSSTGWVACRPSATRQIAVLCERCTCSLVGVASKSTRLKSSKWLIYNMEHVL